MHKRAVEGVKAAQTHSGKSLTLVHMPPFRHSEAHDTVPQVDEAGSRISVVESVNGSQVHWASEQVPRSLQVSVAQKLSTQVQEDLCRGVKV